MKSITPITNIKFNFNENCNQNEDSYDLMSRIQRFFGISYGLNSKSRTWRKPIDAIYLLYQFIICIIIIISNSYLLIKLIYFTTNKNNEVTNITETGMISFSINFTLRHMNAIISLIFFSFKSKQMDIFILKLRQLINNLNKNSGNLSLKLKRLRHIVYIYYFYILMTCVFIYIVGYLRIQIYWALITEIYIYNFVYSTDLYLIYFINYLLIIQQLFNDNLEKIRANHSLSLIEVRDIKKQFVSIQSLIADLNNILSPNLLIVCGILTYELTTCSFFTFYVVKYDINSKMILNTIPALFGFFMALSRLLILCVLSEKINTKV